MTERLSSGSSAAYEYRVPIHLTHLEIAGTLAALRAVLDSAPYGKPAPLLAVERKLEEALR